MKLSTKVAYNTIVQFASKIISTILGLLAIAFITRYLGQAGFGQYTIVITFVSFFAILADLGLTLVTAQMISDPEADKQKILNNLFSLRLISAIVFLSLAPLLVLFFPYDGIVKIGVAVTVFAFLFASLNQVFVGLFQRELRMDRASIAEVVNRVALVVGVYLAVKFDAGLVGILIINVLASLINFLLHFLLSRKFARIRLEFDFKIWKQIARKSWPLAATIALNLIYLKADTLILSIFQPEAIVGVYGAAYRVIDVLTAVPFMFAGVILPLLTASWLAGNLDYFKTIIQRSFNFMVLLAVPLVVGTQFLAKSVMVVVAGEKFAVSGFILKILIIAAALIFFGAIFSHAIIALDKQAKLIRAYLFVSLTSLAGYFIFIPRFSYLGAAGVTIYSELAIALASVYFVWKFSRFLPNFKIIYQSLAASSAMGLVLYFLPASFYGRADGLFITLALAVFTYFVFLYIVKGITRKDIMSLFNR